MRDIRDNKVKMMARLTRVNEEILERYLDEVERPPQVPASNHGSRSATTTHKEGRNNEFGNA